MSSFLEILAPYLMPVVLCCLAVALWRRYVESLADPRCPLPLPPGTVGLPLVGETLAMMIKVSSPRSANRPEPAWQKWLNLPTNGTPQHVDIEKDGRSPTRMAKKS